MKKVLEISGTSQVISIHRVLGAGFVVLRALELNTKDNLHATLTTINGKQYGTLSSRFAPEEITLKPAGSTARITLLQSWYADIIKETFSAIINRVPGVLEVVSFMDDDEITCIFESAEEAEDFINRIE